MKNFLILLISFSSILLADCNSRDYRYNEITKSETCIIGDFTKKTEISCSNTLLACRIASDYFNTNIENLYVPHSYGIYIRQLINSGGFEALHPKK